MIDKQSEENLRRVKLEADKQISSEMKTSDSKSAKIQQELILSRNSLQNLTTDHRNQEMELRRVSIVVAMLSKEHFIWDFTITNWIFIKYRLI